MCILLQYLCEMWQRILKFALWLVYDNYGAYQWI